MKEEILNVSDINVSSQDHFDLSRTRFGGRRQKTKMTARRQAVGYEADLCVLSCSVLSSRGSSQPRN